MPIMTRMRDSMPVILFGLLFAFILLIVFEWGMDYMGLSSGRAEVVGSINGKKISYQEFTELVRNFAENQKAQSGVEPDENQLKQAREQVWQSLVTQQVISEEIARLGITVTDQELLEWVRGDNPPEDLRRNFVDSTGQFRKDLYEQFLSNPNQFIQDPQGNNPNYGTAWLADYERNLRQRRAQEKLQSIVLASVRVNEGEMQQRFIDQQLKFEALYALFDPNVWVKDEDVKVGDDDLRTYYGENLEQYKFEATRKLKFVQFLETPSASDTTASRNEIEDVAKKARAGIDFFQLVDTYSTRTDSGSFFRHGELAAGVERVAFAARVGDIVGPIQESDGFHLIKVLEERKSKDEYVQASHILFSIDGELDSAAVKLQAQEVAKQARTGKDFAELARTYSKDPGTAPRGGDLGWFAKGRMVKQFEDAAFKARPGEVVGPVRTQFGLHVIKVHARDARELKLASVIIPIEPSPQTKNDVFERARDFAYNAKENEFVKEAESSGFAVKEAEIREKGGVIPGLGVLEGATRWAFDHKVGSVSEPFSLPNGYVVFSIAEAKEAGVRPFDDVKESLRPAVLRKLKTENTKRIAEELKAKFGPADSLTKLSAVNPSVSVQHTGQFTLAGGIAGIGRDQAVIGAVSALSPGEFSSPVEGLRGVYLLQLASRSEFDSTAYTAQRDVLRTQMIQDKRNRFLTAWLEKLKEDAEIEDNRDILFR